MIEGEERRRSMRVESALLFRHRRLTEAECAALVPEILHRPSDFMLDDEDLELNSPTDESWQRVEAVLSNFYQMLRDIQHQVDTMVALQRGEPAPPSPHRSDRAINISGDGVAFASESEIEPGTKMHLTFDLTRFPHRTIECLGEVVSCEPLEGEPGTVVVRVKYTHIREIDRDRIINYVFKIQRRQIRHLRAAEAR